MKTFLKYLSVFLLGVLITQTPDLVYIYGQSVESKYQKSECADKGIGKNECHFNVYHDKFVQENPKLDRIKTYLILGQGPAYWVLTGRCSNKIFYNPSATKDSGKITMRNYFFSRCSRLMIMASDLIFQDADQKQPFKYGQGTF